MNRFLEGYNVPDVNSSVIMFLVLVFLVLSWLEALQAAHHVSRSALIMEQRKRKEARTAAAEAHYRVRERKQSERQERQEARNKIRQKWCNN
jgi:hypothetical protein